MKYCTKCGTQVPDDSKFCTKCGSKLNGEPAESPSKSKKSTLIGVGAVLVVAVVAVLFVTSIMGGKAKVGSKKWEKQYEKRMEAYQGYYAEHMNDWASVGGLILLDEDSYPYMLLYCQNKESDDYVDMSVIGYEDKEAKVIGGKLNTRGLVPHSGDGYCFFEEGEGEKYYVLKDGDFVELSREDIESSGWRIDDEDESYFFDTSTSPYSYIGKRMISDIIALHGVETRHSELREPGYLLLGHSHSHYSTNSVSEEGDFYLGSKKVDASKFYETLYGYYDEGNSVCASGTAFYPFSVGYNFESSFNQILREISDVKPASSLELMAFYMESWDKNTKEDTRGTSPGVVLAEADVASAVLESPVEDWKVHLKCRGSIEYAKLDEDADESLSFVLYDVDGDDIPEAFIGGGYFNASASEGILCDAFSSDGKFLSQDVDSSENREAVKSTIYQMGKGGEFEKITSLYCDETDYDSGEVESISCKKDDKDCTYAEYLSGYANVDSVGWFDFDSLSTSGNLEEYKKAVDDWKRDIEVSLEDKGYYTGCDYGLRKAYPEAYEAFDAYMKFIAEDEDIRGTFLYLDDDAYPEFVRMSGTLYTYKDGKVTEVESFSARDLMYLKTGYIVSEGRGENGLWWGAYRLNGTKVEEASEGTGHFSESGLVDINIDEAVSVGYGHMILTDALHNLFLWEEPKQGVDEKTGDFDASAYVKALLDNSYKGDSSAFVEQKIGTKEQAEQLYEDGIDTEVSSAISETSVSEELKSEFRDVFKDLFKNVKYTVCGAVREGDTYEVGVKYQKMNVFASAEEKYNVGWVAYEDETTRKYLAGEEYEELTSEKLYSILKDAIKDSMDGRTYSGVARTIIHIELSGGVWVPNEDDISNLEGLLFDIEAVK